MRVRAVHGVARAKVHGFVGERRLAAIEGERQLAVVEGERELTAVEGERGLTAFEGERRPTAVEGEGRLVAVRVHGVDRVRENEEAAGQKRSDSRNVIREGSFEKKRDY